MDVNVVVVVYVNTGRPTPLRRRIWSNLRLNSFSRANARPQGLCGMVHAKCDFIKQSNVFSTATSYSHAETHEERLLIFSRNAQIDSQSEHCEEAFQARGHGGYLSPERNWPP
jgi:hypothetical protein